MSFKSWFEDASMRKMMIANMALAKSTTPVVACKFAQVGQVILVRNSSRLSLMYALMSMTSNSDLTNFYLRIYEFYEFYISFNS